MSPRAYDKEMIDLLNFESRVAIVTGAGQGMGKAHATTLASRGARVVVNDVSREHAEQVVKEITDAGGTAVADLHDVANEAPAIVQTALDAFGRLDIVVNNAGIIRVGLFGEQSSEEFWKVFDVSFKGTAELSRAAWPHLMQSGSGRLILVSSSGVLANPGASAYGAAKGAIWALGNTLAMEGDRVGVQVSTLMPTAWTPMTESAYSDPNIISTLRDGLGPEHVANFVAYLSHQDTAVHGDMFQVSGGRAGRMVLAGLPRLQSTENTPEGWTGVADQLKADSDQLTQYRVTGEQFADEMIAANPSVAEAFKNMNPADLGT
ncbi:SDR family NAD(P)-dependent oxidoreductase [Arthrobacter sp. I2-34]|uniref:SDR family NAD(P)-dependent oxidoreductase n=1 Tax=Arthrobacter hankyongi TaxID=2904801 RepID=A0ABS9LBW7_9MICC|nr:SDR family NAD(P)-dependent oxidoreductase [Arthrobacter hankyongi]MCG2624096.1 SDR family NAD(P)-dependent oxidoreductase [Arthrobacter hankyongi]